MTKTRRQKLSEGINVYLLGILLIVGGSLAYLESTDWIALNSTFVFVTGDNLTGNFDVVGNVLINGILDIIHTATETDDHAVEIDVNATGHGDVKGIDIDYITGAIQKGDDEGIILINVDETGSTGGEIFAVEVLATEGDAGIYAIKTGAMVGVIHQDSGEFVNAILGTDNTPSTNVTAMIDANISTTTAIFENDNEYIIIGAITPFEELEFIYTTPANLNIKPTYWHSTSGEGQYAQFTPVDGTDGAKHNGIVAWDASDLTNHAKDDLTGTFNIKIIRTRNILITTPILGYMKDAVTTEYVWDKEGDVNIKDITASGIAYLTGLTKCANSDPCDDADTIKISMPSGELCCV